MCYACEHPCWRDGGEAECAVSDEDFHAALDERDTARKIIDLMERLQYSLRADKRHTFSEQRPDSGAPDEGTT